MRVVILNPRQRVKDLGSLSATVPAPRHPRISSS